MKRPVLDVLSGGLLATLQDLGRPGSTHLGVSPGGAADQQALAIGNRLTGNEEGAAGIEMTMTGGSFRFLADTWIALTGGDCSPHVDGIPMAMWYSFPVKRGQALVTGSISQGLRSYLCLHGGIDVPSLLGSKSTLLSSRWGGLEGRALMSGDRLSAGASIVRPPGYRRAGIDVRYLYRTAGPLRVTRGPQWDWFTQEARTVFLGHEFEVTTEANRNGLRLSGPRLEAMNASELVTEGVSAGAIQVPAGGQPLVLFCEQQTTGGYPKIANIIRADLFRVGQLRPGDKIRFEEVSIEEAWRVLRERDELCRRPLT